MAKDREPTPEERDAEEQQKLRRPDDELKDLEPADEQEEDVVRGGSAKKITQP